MSEPKTKPTEIVRYRVASELAPRSGNLDLDFIRVTGRFEFEVLRDEGIEARHDDDGPIGTGCWHFMEAMAPAPAFRRLAQWMEGQRRGFELLPSRLTDADVAGLLRIRGMTIEDVGRAPDFPWGDGQEQEG